MDEHRHTILTGPFTKVFKGFDNKERRHIHLLLMRYYTLYHLPQRSSKQNKEMKALEWVVTTLQNVETI